ncbi:MAG TPA: proline--tRNA ligase [Firmicutes bacterium]|nr:proline--tRNA ligase [Bacillota bacterium]
MRMSKLLMPTLREVPAEAEIASHQLMLRAAMMRKVAAGIYTYLPLGFRVLQKITQIVREEMDAAGGQEVLLPIIQPAELWHETGRWDDYGEEMFKLSDRNDRQFCLGPTHEEIITALVRNEVRSYRQLPLMLYQIQNKYRDEIRPRFGVMRGREFIMKDLYSFDRDEEGLDKSYWAMFHAYERVFARCGLNFRPVEADPGAIGGNQTHEFMAIADAGEAEIVYCSTCDYAANVEKARCLTPPAEPTGREDQLAEVATPGVKTIEELEKFFNRPASEMMKTLIYRGGEQVVAAVLRGDHEVNEIKLARAVGCLEVELADDETIERVTGAPRGFAGPVGLKNCKIIADPAVMNIESGITGGNKVDVHLQGVKPGRDFVPDMVIDIRKAQPGDPCPCGKGILQGARGIEVGQVFKLGTKYSKPLGATFADEDGVERPLIMGCYGIGISRTMAAIIEQYHDEHGICWPVSVAPYHVDVVPVNYRDEQQRTAAERVYAELTAAGVEAVIDDRDERPGVKFKDADLIGFPIRITVGPRGLAEGQVEVRWRATGEEYLISLNEVVSHVQDRIASAIAESKRRCKG